MPDDHLRARLDQLSLGQKIRLLTGADFWTTHPEPAAGLRPIVLSDGPAGVRGQTFDERDHSLSLPSATTLGATWDVDLAYQYATVLADEARRQGIDIVLGPTINLHRSPLGGRHFEAFSEDPLLTGAVAVGYIRGLQDAGIGATPKHYVANDAETDRFTVDNQISERALREVYLAPFERAVTEARAWLVMSAYNGVNGATMSENPLLRTPLATEWGFDGVVVSDWTAVRTTVPAARAAQDLVMPGPDGPWGDTLLAAVEAGQVSTAAIDEKVLRLLRLARRLGALSGLPPAVTHPPRPRDGIALARQVASVGAVLVRNHRELLPLERAALRRVAVIGHNAQIARIQGGGSATVLPSGVVSPLEGLRAALGPDVEVRYALGAVVDRGVLPLPRPAIVNPVTGDPGVRLRYLDASGVAVAVEDRLAADLLWVSTGLPERTHTFEMTTLYRPKATGIEHLACAALGRVRMIVDGIEVVDTTLSAESRAFVDAPREVPTAVVAVPARAGKDIVVTLVVTPPMDGPFRQASIVLGTVARLDSGEAEIARAVDLARGSDVAVVVVGTSSALESEGYDRTTLALPGRQDDLVSAVARANPNTVVVVNSGAPVLLPWREEVGAILVCWFAGQEFGNALADLLLGDVEPGGRLPTTWPATQEDVPVLATTPTEGLLRYDEGVHIGYRAWLRRSIAPAYPFGHGLGYTEWEFQSVSAPQFSPIGQPVAVTVRVANVGRRAGRQIVQVYLERPDSAVDRPTRWLVGFAPVMAEPGTQTEVTVTVEPRSFAHFDGCWRTEPGQFQIVVGGSVVDRALATSVTLTGDGDTPVPSRL
jgi:beta-glucosidase